MNYIHLTKPRSVSLLLLAALAGMVMAAPELPSAALLAQTLLGGALAAGGANALNCYLDRDLDGRMVRTAMRPLATGRVDANRALLFGIALCVLSLLILALRVNPLAALLAAAGIGYYVVVYTLWLKRMSSFNVVIGGGAGALPLLVGWAAVAGHLPSEALWLGAVVICWTPPHFWSLALIRRREYALAGIPMLPVVRGAEATRRQILLYCVALLGLTLLLVPAGLAGPAFLGVALLLGLSLVVMALRLVYQATDRAAWLLYRYSIVYLALLFGSMILDHMLQW